MKSKKRNHPDFYLKTTLITTVFACIAFYLPMINNSSYSLSQTLPAFILFLLMIFTPFSIYHNCIRGQTDDEQTILKNFRNLSMSNQEKMVEYLDTLIEDEKENEVT